VSDAASSPCIRLCVVDPETGFCRGCRRTLAEIVAWPTLSEDDKRRILAQLPLRR
jgi:uncharacterized protein